MHSTLQQHPKTTTTNLSTMFMVFAIAAFVGLLALRIYNLTHGIAGEWVMVSGKLTPPDNTMGEMILFWITCFYAGAAFIIKCCRR